MNSILATVKEALGVELDYSGFDTEITVAINAAIFELKQLGIDIPDGFAITGIEETWDQMYDDAEGGIEAAKNFIILKTRLSFDPPSTSFLISAIDRQLLQLQWRLMVEVDPPIEEEV